MLTQTVSELKLFTIMVRVLFSMVRGESDKHRFWLFAKGNVSCHSIFKKTVCDTQSTTP